MRILVNKSCKQATTVLGGAQTSGCLNTCQMYKVTEGIDKSQDKTCYVNRILLYITYACFNWKIKFPPCRLTRYTRDQETQL